MSKRRGAPVSWEGDEGDRGGGWVGEGSKIQ
jgi:hypothetical protein